MAAASSAPARAAARLVQRRFLSSSGKVLSEEEKAAENVYIKAKKEAKLDLALAQHGLSMGGDTKSVTFKIPFFDQLSMKRVDPSQLVVHIKRKLTKEERLELVIAKREDRGKYQARTAVKQKKKMEQEKLEKLARKGPSPGEQVSSTPSSAANDAKTGGGPTESTSAGVSTDKNRNYAVPVAEIIVMGVKPEFPLDVIDEDYGRL